MKYDFKAIENKWQEVWDKIELYKAPEMPGKDKFYMLGMFA